MNELGEESVRVTSFPYTVCPSGISGCGGSFRATIGSIQNVAVWCVDSQLSVPSNQTYNAYIASLALPTAQFNDSDIVRYGGVTNSTSTDWQYSLLSGYSYGASNPGSAQVRYQLAAILVSQYQTSGGSSQYESPSNSSRNKSIQRAIWRLLDTGPEGDLSGSIYEGLSGGSSSYDWIDYAFSVLHTGTFDFSKWAVVSGNYDHVKGKLYGNPKVQTFLVQVATPEPQHYALLLVSLLGGLGYYRRRKAAAMPVSEDC